MVKRSLQGGSGDCMCKIAMQWEYVLVFWLQTASGLQHSHSVSRDRRGGVFNNEWVITDENSERKRGHPAR